MDGGREHRAFLIVASPRHAGRFSATIHLDIKLTLIAISDRTGMSVSQVTDEVLYAGLVEMQEL